MELSSLGTVSIEVVHINALPLPVCEDNRSQLLLDDSLRAALKAMTNSSMSSPASAATAAEWLLAERDNAVIADRFRSQLRTQALDRLAGNVAGGRLLSSGNSSFSLACSVAGSWNLRMSDAGAGSAEEGQAEGESVLDIALLAFDRDEDVATTYRILSLPTRGNLFAATAVTGESFTSSAQRIFMEIGGSFYQVPLLRKHMQSRVPLALCPP